MLSHVEWSSQSFSPSWDVGCSIWWVNTFNGLVELLVCASEKIVANEISECTSFGDLVWDAFLRGVRLGLMRNMFWAMLVKEGL
jgi:hypothetical protein